MRCLKSEIVHKGVTMITAIKNDKMVGSNANHWKCDPWLWCQDWTFLVCSSNGWSSGFCGGNGGLNRPEDREHCTICGLRRLSMDWDQRIDHRLVLGTTWCGNLCSVVTSFCGLSQILDQLSKSASRSLLLLLKKYPSRPLLAMVPLHALLMGNQESVCISKSPAVTGYAPSLIIFPSSQPEAFHRIAPIMPSVLSSIRNQASQDDVAGMQHSGSSKWCIYHRATNAKRLIKDYAVSDLQTLAKLLWGF